MLVKLFESVHAEFTNSYVAKGIAMNALRLTIAAMLICGLPAEARSDVPVVSNTCHVGTDGTVEYTWSVTAKVEGPEVLSISEISRLRGKSKLTDGGESLWYSKAERKEEAKIAFVISPASDTRKRSIRFTGTNRSTTSQTISDSATVSIKTSTLKEAAGKSHVVDIVVNDKGKEVERYIVAIRMSQLDRHPELTEKIREVRTIAGTLPMKRVTFVAEITQPAKLIDRYGGASNKRR